MGKSQREKGKLGEREAARLITETWGIPARRAQQYRGARDASDLITIPGLAVEVKLRTAGNPAAWLAQAQAEAGADLAVVVHRKPRQPWLLTLQADRLAELIGLLGDAREVYEAPNDDSGWTGDEP